MTLKPLFDRVIVEEEKEEKSKSGIFLGGESSNAVKKGKVIYVGQGTEKDDGSLSTMFVKVGDRVIFNKYTSSEAVIDEKQVLILRQTDILAIIE